MREIFDAVDFDTPTANEGTDPPSPMRTRDEAIDTMADFLTFAYNENFRFWEGGFEGAGLEGPTANGVWPGPGDSVQTACNASTNDQTAAFCSADDTIYVSQQWAFNLWEHGCAAPTRCDENVAGDFSVAYVVGHEMGHNIEHELNLYELGLPIYRMELLADCMAGLWANRAYYEGLLEPGDVEEAIAAANLVGDYNFLDPDHHGTPDERVTAFSLGWNTGNLSECAVYLDASPIGS